MEVVSVFKGIHYQVDMLNDYDGGITQQRRPVNFTQKHAKPTTHAEFSVLLSGNCPTCGSTLAGNNGKFCIPDQTWWEFDPNQTVTGKPEEKA